MVCVHYCRTIDSVSAAYAKGMIRFYPGDPKTVVDVVSLFQYFSFSFWVQLQYGSSLLYLYASLDVEKIENDATCVCVYMLFQPLRSSHVQCVFVNIF